MCWHNAVTCYLMLPKWCSLTSCIIPAVGQVGAAADKPSQHVQHDQLHIHSRNHT